MKELIFGMYKFKRIDGEWRYSLSNIDNWLKESNRIWIAMLDEIVALRERVEKLENPIAPITVRHLRIAAGMTLHDLSEKTGFDVVVISKWENQKGAITKDEMAKIRKVCNIAAESTGRG